jgi:hypothetical protein
VSLPSQAGSAACAAVGIAITIIDTSAAVESVEIMRVFFICIVLII